MGEEHQEFLVASAESLQFDQNQLVFVGDLWMTSLVGWLVGCVDDLMTWCDSCAFLMTNANKNNGTKPWTQMTSPVIPVSFQVVLVVLSGATNAAGGTNSLHFHGKIEGYAIDLEGW